MSSSLSESNTRTNRESAHGYGGYEADGPESPEKALERDMILEEYRNDKDAILMAIKQAIKARNYKEAQEFIYKYRAAAKIDENFATLSRMTAQGLERDKKIEKIVTVLDATPDDDYDTRIVLYERILKVIPDDEFYRAKLDEARAAKGLQPSTPAATTNHKAIQKADKKEHSPVPVIIGIIVFVIVLFLIFGL